MPSHATYPNPPFGANVEPSDVVHESDATVSRETGKRYAEEHGDLYTEALARVHAAAGKPIASLFELPKGNGTEKERDKRAKQGKIKRKSFLLNAVFPC